MEPITAALILIITLGLGNEIVENQKEITSQEIEIVLLQQQVNNLENTLVRLAGSHSAVAANNTVINETQDAAIDDLYSRYDYLDEAQDKSIDDLHKRVDYLDKKVDILHP